MPAEQNLASGLSKGLHAAEHPAHIAGYAWLNGRRLPSDRSRNVPKILLAVLQRERCNNVVVHERILSADDRATWRRWLAANYQTMDEIWLRYHRAHTGKPRVAYNDAVEEALCFGWIDSTVKSIDEDAYAQRFTPRRARSAYSQTNRERLRRLIDQGQVMPAVTVEVADVLDEPFVVPPDIEAALRVDPAVWKNFTAYSDAYQRIRIAYVDSARGRQDEFDKRLANLLRKTAADSQFGFGIESYY